MKYRQYISVTTKSKNTRGRRYHTFQQKLDDKLDRIDRILDINNKQTRVPCLGVKENKMGTCWSF